MSQALYRKYRSKALAEVVGQEHITDVLAQAIKSGHIAHAYLLTGPRGVGKTSIARILAHEINKLPYTDESTHLDIIEIDAASNRRIDDIRDLREKVHTAPTSAAYKVYIIDEVHMLTGESFNALLKILEEPPAHVIFILATTELHKLPATIVSRTQRYTFRPIPGDKVVSHLKHIAKQEKIDITDEALDLIAAHGDGSFRDSISLLDQLSAHDQKIDESIVESMLGLAPKERIEKLVDQLVARDSNAVAASLDQFQKAGNSNGMVTRQLTETLRQSATKHPELYELLDKLLEVPKAYDPSLKLMTTLVLFTLEGSKPAPRSAPAIAAKPALTIEKLPEPPIPRAKPVKEEPKAVEPAEPVIQPSDAIAFDIARWPEVMAQIRTKNAPLYSIVKQMVPSSEKDGLLLILSSKFALHSSKLQNPKYRGSLLSIITDLCNGCPELEIRIDKSIEIAPEPPRPTPTLSSQATSVAAMMGGGEAVNVPTI